ncbi:G-protein coupled receptor 4-like protein [Lates japonicus]|uniref:G-protein coupled receptor 4-like protein n=1 Tax=Lates japonicus TaxID=270547 RepID=A0AAD3NB45_LATJO|nr:G-protein coupled receptor 4-like protein [Lates japonicus]
MNSMKPKTQTMMETTTEDLMLRLRWYHSGQVRSLTMFAVYVINLLISDLIQICCLMIWVVLWLANFWEDNMVRCVSSLLYYGAVLASAGFMVCIALERYLVVAWPLWYRFRRSIKSSVLVSIIVWVFCFTEFIISSFVPIFRPSSSSSPSPCSSSPWLGP